ncbi:MAG: preprotein translocase subunit SecY [Oscillospiraceae bacterium]|jgi:preprotein translocase subunit SecY|nr:preprotein translocase subunit SecY [Oscillospiraceae bacterium]
MNYLSAVWKIPDLRKKIFYTLMILLVFCFGSALFVPYLDNDTMSELVKNSALLDFMNNITGGALGNGTLFAMSITPYINASIIMQLLCVALPPLERLQKEGETGQKVINRITKFLALGIGLFQASAFYLGLRSQGCLKFNDFRNLNGELPATLLTMFTIIITFTAGASLIIWLGDQISDKGIGNGVSIILFAGIVSRLPVTAYDLVKSVSVDKSKLYLIPLVFVLYLTMLTLTVLMTNAERRIPIQYAKRMVGRKMYGGQSSHIPIKVAMAGVMPIIFAMSIMTLPQTICYWFGITETSAKTGSWWTDFWIWFLAHFNQSTIWYGIIYFFLIIGFNYFYISMQYNPTEIANNLKKNNGAIPGYRPGKPTADFIQNALGKITLIGAIFLGFVALVPIIFTITTRVSGSAMALGGTSLLIVVGVVQETGKSIQSQMMMRKHRGFLE